jgi:hypothetical protein
MAGEEEAGLSLGVLMIINGSIIILIYLCSRFQQKLKRMRDKMDVAAHATAVAAKRSKQGVGRVGLKVGSTVNKGIGKGLGNVKSGVLHLPGARKLGAKVHASSVAEMEEAKMAEEGAGRPGANAESNEM